MTQEEFYLFMQKFRCVYGEITKDVEAQILALVEKGAEPQQAAKEIMRTQPLGMGLSPPLGELLVSAAVNGTGRKRKEFTKSMLESMKGTLVNQPWSADNMPLSPRLHKINGVMRQALNDEIYTAMKNGTNWVELSRKIYDGYNNGDNKIKKAKEVPKYLKEVSQTAKLVMNNPVEFEQYKEFLRHLQRKTGRLNTPGLRAAYSELLKAAEKGKEKAIERAIKTALEERSRYHAERIARTELARAWADGFYAKTLPDEDVVAYRWKLSSNHPIRDICDFHATANLYGLGAGVYPKDRMPRLPAHPHCRCHILEIFDGELDGKTRRDNEVHERGQKFLESLSRNEQEKLLGIDGAKKWREGGEWENHLVGWSGHEKPQSRLDKIVKGNPDVHKIGTIDKGIYGAVAKNINTDEVVITEQQIKHIKERHPNDYERFSKNFPQIIKDPDYIMEANKPNTAFVLKSINGEKFELILRLVTKNDPVGYKNSIITFLKTSDKKWNKYIRNKKILYERG